METKDEISTDQRAERSQGFYDRCDAVNMPHSSTPEELRAKEAEILRELMEEGDSASGVKKF